MRKVLLMHLLLGSLLLFGCGSKDQGKTDPAPDSSAAAQKPAMGNMGSGSAESTIPVEVTPVIQDEISSFLLYSSTMETEELADVYSRISGLVEKLYVEEGDHVKKNQALVQIEQAEYALLEQEALVKYNQAKSDFKRFETLKEKNLISEEEFENAKLTLRQAELQWKQAKLNLDYTMVRSPIDGVVGERDVRLGDRIQTSSKLFTISNLSEKVVKVYVPQDEMPRLFDNQPATVTTDVLPGQEFPAWIKRMSPIIDPQSGTFKVTVGVRDPQNRLKPGMFVSVQIIVDTHKNSMLLPKAALVYENERSFFYVVKGDSVQKMELKKGFEDAQKVEVLNDVKKGESVVVLGQTGLKDGSRIKITNERYYPWQKIRKENTGEETAGKVS